MATDETKIAGITLRTAQRNLETAELTHKKISETISMRTATVAQIAATLLASDNWPKQISGSPKWGAGAAVKIAEEIMAEAEASAAKAKEMQAAKDVG